MKSIVLEKEKFISFAWQHLLLLVSLFFLALGVAICIRSCLGSSVISSAPYAFTLAGEAGMAPELSLGMYTNILNVILVACQIVVLGRQFHPVQLLQLFIGVVFGVLIDASMVLTSGLVADGLWWQLLAMIVGSTIMAVGVAMEIRCGSITMPGEGLPAALSRRTGRPFGTMKIYVDVALVATATAAMLLFFGEWRWNIVGIGTLFASVYCGAAVKFISRRLAWFDRLLGYQPGFRRYFFGLAKYIHSRLRSE
ncbi:MAG: hypothetical protein J1E63_09880 [Muribaculaceae bacterium]|nr:hypothetical protein [Muribaculaceae bacterium]